MDMTHQQCRAARALLGWSAEDLAAAAGIGVATVRRFESGGTVREGSIATIRETLERAGLEFIPIGGSSRKGGAGVRST